jgi:hypothetical protein
VRSMRNSLRMAAQTDGSGSGKQQPFAPAVRTRALHPSTLRGHPSMS